MSRATDRTFWLNVAVVISVLVVSAYPIVELTGLSFGAPDPPASAAPPTPPSGARDSLNPAIWIEGGTFLEGSDNPGKTDDPASPYSTGDERPPRRMRVKGFWIQEHEVTKRSTGGSPANTTSRTGRDAIP